MQNEYFHSKLPILKLKENRVLDEKKFPKTM